MAEFRPSSSKEAQKMSIEEQHFWPYKYKIWQKVAAKGREIFLLSFRAETMKLFVIFRFFFIGNERKIFCYNVFCLKSWFYR
jgi:hypothetical protein